MASGIGSTPAGVLFENELKINNTASVIKQDNTKKNFRRAILWPHVIVFTALHIGAIYGFYLMLTSTKFITLIFTYILYMCSGLGITAGAHRLWSHNAYKANFPLRVVLMIFHSMAYQYTIWRWVKNHRIHHKFCDTDADPHNAGRGFFYSHVGWMLCEEHPDFTKKLNTIDMADIEADSIASFQNKYCHIVMPLMAFVLPTVIPVYFWNETYCNAFFVPTILRYVIGLNMTFLINSAAHIFGQRPYDKNIGPAENVVVAMGAWGEGWHNFHHVFPWDYKAAELGNYRLNAATAFIDFCAKMGWAYDLKRVSNEIVKQRCQRTGDGSHEIWGWGDKDQPAEEREAAIIECARKKMT